MQKLPEAFTKLCVTERHEGLRIHLYVLYMMYTLLYMVYSDCPHTDFLEPRATAS